MMSAANPDGDGHAALPALLAALLHKRGALDGWRRRLQAVDRTLLAAVPALGRFDWETVIVLAR
jgi:hypothetical protein